MPECQNCGSFVTTEYVRVFAPNGEQHPRVCPRCEDMVRDGNDVREARSKRH
jgi:NAD-dependent SIR2 family protein deacetylase